MTTGDMTTGDMWQEIGHKWSLSSWCNPMQEKWSKGHKSNFQERWSKCFPWRVKSLLDSQSSQVCKSLSHEPVGWKLDPLG